MIENKKLQIKFFVYDKHIVKVKKLKREWFYGIEFYVEKIFHCKKIFIFLINEYVFR